MPTRNATSSYGAPAWNRIVHQLSSSLSGTNLHSSISPLVRKGRSLRLIRQFRIKEIEPIPLDDLRRGVLRVIVNLIKLIPIEPHFHFVEKYRLQRRVFGQPVKRLVRKQNLVRHLLLIILHIADQRLVSIQYSPRFPLRDTCFHAPSVGFSRWHR